MLVANTAKNAGTVMVYAYQKNLCDTIVKRILKNINQGQYAEVEYSQHGSDILQYCAYQLGENFTQMKLLRKGMAYHHGDLPQDIREYIEELLETGEIQIVICTSTLAEGVNFPIKTLVLAYLNDYNEETNRNVLINPEKIKNIEGRVGRAGRETYGTIVLMDDKFWSKVLPAMKNEISRHFKGTLYRRLNLADVTDEQWRDNKRLIAAIDYTLTKSKGNKNLQDVNVRALAEGSFAYKCCGDEEKERLVAILEERYSKINSFFASRSYESYQHSGLSISEIESLEPISEDLIGDLKECQGGDIPNMIARMIDFVKDLNFPEDYEKPKKLKPLLFTKENLTVVADGWIKGERYVTISQETKIPVEVVIKIVNRLTNLYAYKIQSILTYLSEVYEIDNPNVDAIPKYLQLGVSNDFELFLMNQRLSNRLVVRIMNYIVEHNQWDAMSDEESLIEIIRNKALVKSQIDELSIPQLLKRVVKDWIDNIERRNLIK